jgi:hypothetical protein
MAPPSSTDEHRMLGIESSEATFLFRQLLLLVQQSSTFLTSSWRHQTRPSSAQFQTAKGHPQATTVVLQNTFH